MWAIVTVYSLIIFGTMFALSAADDDAAANFPFVLLV